MKLPQGVVYDQLTLYSATGTLTFGFCVGVPALCCLAGALGLFFGCRDKRKDKNHRGFVYQEVQNPLMDDKTYEL